MYHMYYSLHRVIQAMEVYLHNPWLTYGVGLHRLREAGFAPEIMEDLDERRFRLVSGSCFSDYTRPFLNI